MSDNHGSSGGSAARIAGGIGVPIAVLVIAGLALSRCNGGSEPRRDQREEREAVRETPASAAFTAAPSARSQTFSVPAPAISAGSGSKIKSEGKTLCTADHVNPADFKFRYLNRSWKWVDTVPADGVREWEVFSANGTPRTYEYFWDTSRDCQS